MIFAGLKFSGIKNEKIQFQENLLQLENSKFSDKMIFTGLIFSGMKNELRQFQEKLLQLEK